MGDLDAMPQTPEPPPSIGMVLATLKTSRDALEEMLFKIRRCGIAGQGAALTDTAREQIGLSIGDLRMAERTIAGMAGKVERE